MNGIIGAIIFMAAMVVVTAVALFISVKKSNRASDISLCIINRFEPDNTAPKISELVEFCKTNEDVRYRIQ